MLCLKALKSKFLNPKFYLSVSHFHNPTSKNPSLHNPAIQYILDEVQESQSSKIQFNRPDEQENLLQKQHKGFSGIQISHPWSEWVDLMERLLKDGYFDEIGNPFASNRELGNKEVNLIRTASLNFARNQYQLIRHLSRKDIMVIAGSGCPSIDRKVVNSGKRLRAHVGISEGNVCSGCILRGDCDRAYVKAREDEGGRTVDVMRFLLMYGLDPVIGSVENKPCLNKGVKESVRTLLKEMVDIRVEEHDCEPPPETTTREWTSSTQEIDVHQEKKPVDARMKPGDWICPKCNFFNFARNIKCLRCNGVVEERLRKSAEEQEHLPLKKGDWICDKNTKCLQCKEKPSKRQLNPGEWECESCNYLNFRRNMVCLKCDHKRPIASNNADNIASQPVKSHHTQPWFRQEKQTRYEGDDEPSTFVDNGNEDHISSCNSLNRAPSCMHFPVAGGKSDFSRNVQKQELSKMEMVENARVDDDGDMAEWFEGVRK